MREYAAGHQTYSDARDWQADTKPRASLELARRDLAQLMIQTRNDEWAWANDLQLVSRATADSVWLPVDDAARHTAQAVLESLAIEASRIGDGVLQGKDLARMFGKAARALGSNPTQNPEEFD